MFRALAQRCWWHGHAHGQARLASTVAKYNKTINLNTSLRAQVSFLGGRVDAELLLSNRPTVMGNKEATVAQHDTTRLLRHHEFQPTTFAIRGCGLGFYPGAGQQQRVDDSILAVARLTADTLGGTEPISLATMFNTAAVQRLKALLTSNPRLRDDFMRAPVFGMGPNVQLYNGRDWTNNTETIATAVSLAMVAAYNPELRRELLQELQDKSIIRNNTDAAGESEPWDVLNKRLYNCKAWTQQDGRAPRAPVRDVLLCCFEEKLSVNTGLVLAFMRSYNKTERVAAALILGRLMQAGIMV